MGAREASPVTAAPHIVHVIAGKAEPNLLDLYDR